jgi:hypothetical protein
MMHMPGCLVVFVRFEPPILDHEVRHGIGC